MIEYNALMVEYRALLKRALDSGEKGRERQREGERGREREREEERGREREREGERGRETERDGERRREQEREKGDGTQERCTKTWKWDSRIERHT